MNGNKIFGYMQFAFVAMYLFMGFALLTFPAFKEKFPDNLRIGFAVVLLAFAGYRAYMAYTKYFSPRARRRNEGNADKQACDSIRHIW